MKAVFFKYHANTLRKDLRDSADNRCGLVDPDFWSNSMPLWTICGPYVRNNLEGKDVVFFLPHKNVLESAGLWKGSYVFTGVLVVNDFLRNYNELKSDSRISASYKRKYARSLEDHLENDKLKTRSIRLKNIVLGDKTKSRWLWPIKQVTTNDVHVTLRNMGIDERDITNRRVPYIRDSTKVKQLYNDLTGETLDG